MLEPRVLAEVDRIKAEAIQISRQGVKYLIPKDQIPQHIFRAREPYSRHIVERLLQPGMTFVDVGANIGIYTLLGASRVGPSGRVYAIEPGPENLEYLKHNIHLNNFRNITVLPIAAGSRSEQREFFLRSVRSHDSLYLSSRKESYQSIMVEVARLDDLIDAPVDLIKMDIEGAELEALTGANPMVTRSSRLQMIVEWSIICQESAGYRAEELPLWFLKRGFSVNKIDERKKVIEPIVEQHIPTLVQLRSDINLLINRTATLIHS